MDYIAVTLGITVTAEPMSSAIHLPFYLTDAYTFQTVTLGGVKCLFLKPQGEPAALPSLKKHLAKIAEQANIPLVLELNSINARQRKALIAAGIPFVVPGNQLYLPFMGAFLQEHYLRRPQKGETLSPAAQLTLFHYLYQGATELYTNGLAERFGLSAMQITRAVRELLALELITTRKDGVRIVITGTEIGAALLDKATPYLQNPVRKRFYIERHALPPGLPLAGLSALSEFTMLNPPDMSVYAFYGKVDELPGTDTLVDPEAQAEIEIWRYPPTPLSAKSSLPDPLSLWMCLTDDDARIALAREELLANVWRKK